ncbi:hypothetical protein O181_030668 [Austropuccinia psidii MF-1]|uniref:RRP15-like protein n=1 Tax=Austropuccinia psidii MF-1 TaxID=1389203 RepID=A0A9Q3CVY4_9BASI|nr:hypothetical protein [Austropuccinia psidii MF-1]
MFKATVQPKSEAHRTKTKIQLPISKASSTESASEEASDSDLSGGESDTQGEDSEDDINFIKKLNREKNGRSADRNQVSQVGKNSDGEVSDDDGQPQRSEKTKKRKRRATSPTSFGLILSQALEASEKSNVAGPSTTLSSLGRSANRMAKQHAEIELKRKQTAAARHQQQEQGHIRDVIGGWAPRPAVPFSEWLVQDPQKWRDQGAYVGGASQEKSLRRLAQTGVVKLFNAIRAAQNVGETNVNEVVPTNLSGAQKRKLQRLAGERGANKPINAAEAKTSDKTIEDDATLTRSKPNVLGSRGKNEALANLSKATFLELIKSSGSKPII